MTTYQIKHTPLAIAFALLLIALSGCSPAKLEPIPSNGTILAFGDSLTVGVGADNANSYPTVLAALSGLTVINSGVSGETTDNGLKRLREVLDNTSPDLLILLEGGNDILRNRDLSETKANLAAMIELALGKGVPVVLIGVPEKALFSNSAPLYTELAEQYQLVFDDSLIADLQRTPSLKSDYIHFNDQGYRKMASAIFELLKENGAL
ncbi:GDSL-type esterase/lipase family protein [Alkalimarinus sediminis]|uniref:GDSL-type esterase/lipase family protein n=1 Tax=Alkalimarinus sediminis TaxID=1632866 RepID=A0A9E8KQL6_9ALTE|nr:GDSL-type esterase/lipase family protein [Alkalimarinus sediminis]UZW76583.1 GDSL-type esterase/lipase family protein [Alkalimarinus sediminis]